MNDADFTPVNIDKPVKKTDELMRLANNLSTDESITNFGLNIQSRNSGLTSEILKNIKNNTAGDAGKQLAQLTTQLTLKPKQSHSLIGKIFNKFHRNSVQMYHNHESMRNSIKTIKTNLIKQKTDLAKYNHVLDVVMAKSKANYAITDKYIDAGLIKMDQIRNEYAPKLRDKITNCTDDAQKTMLEHKYQTLQQKYMRISKRVYALQTSQQAINSQIPQVSLIKSTNNEIIDKINNTVLTVIPRWEDQYTMQFALEAAKNTLDNVNSVDNATNELFKQTAKKVKEQSLRSIEASNNPGITEDTLEQVANEVNETLDVCKAAYLEGDRQRKQAAERIAKINQNYHDRAMKTLAGDGGDILSSQMATSATPEEKDDDYWMKFLDD